MTAAPRLYLSDFSMRRPAFETPQARALDWLVDLHARARPEVDRERMRRLVERVACSSEAIASRGHVVPEVADEGATPFYDVVADPHGPGTAARSARFAEVVTRYFEEEYAGERTGPGDIVHVTCTGYVSPSGAQELVARRGWGAVTRVTHAYHMGCYAALPALRIAAGCLVAPRGAGPGGGESRVDVVHTELCSLHLDPAAGSAEQLVVQSLFGDGLIRYAVRGARPARRALRVLALEEQILPDSRDAMRWAVGDHGMMMTLSADVPRRIAGVLRGFVAGLFAQAGLPMAGGAVYAVHPGGPKIIDGVAEALELDEAQVAVSRGALRDYGNMSSATLPHIWMRLVGDPRVAAGTLVVSLAFGPGLTVCGALARIE